MKKVKLAVVLLPVIFFLASCASLEQLDTNVGAPTEKESVFVMGVAPENYRISIFPGSVEDGRFYQNPLRPAAIYAAANNGYIVGKAAAGEVLGLSNVRIVKSSESLLGLDYKACGDNRTITFTVPKGKVIYLGSIYYLYKKETLDVSYLDEFEDAKTYIDKNFPALREKLEPFPVEWATQLKTCGQGGGKIIIYMRTKTR